MAIEVTTTATEYTVSALPEAHDDHLLYALKVAYRGKGRWAVTRLGRCLGADGQWDWEPTPSERTEEWRNTHRFDLETALRLAQEAAPKVVVNSRTVEQVLAGDGDE